MLYVLYVYGSTPSTKPQPLPNSLTRAKSTYKYDDAYIRVVAKGGGRAGGQTRKKKGGKLEAPSPHAQPDNATFNMDTNRNGRSSGCRRPTHNAAPLRYAPTPTGGQAAPGGEVGSVRQRHSRVKTLPGDGPRWGCSAPLPRQTSCPAGTPCRRSSSQTWTCPPAQPKRGEIGLVSGGREIDWLKISVSPLSAHLHSLLREFTSTSCATAFGFLGSYFILFLVCIRE